MNLRLGNLAAAIASVCVLSPAHAALNLDYIDGTGDTVAAPYVLYDDARSYSLPVLGILYDYFQTGKYESSINPGNPYYVNSTPGAIKDEIVLGTGASGTDVTTNTGVGMDDAFATPNSSGITFFRTASPDPTPTFTGDRTGTWDITLTAFAEFLGPADERENPVFMFNNNQTKSGQATNENLAGWMAVTLYDDPNDGDDVGPLTLYFSNQRSAYGAGGTLNGTTGDEGTPGAPVGPYAGTNDDTDYVLSGGALCYLEATFAITPCPDSNNPNDGISGPINHNLGANQAVYALVFPKLNEILGLSDFGGYDYMSVDFRLGCDPGTIDPEVNCVARDLNNGYEQLFITTTSRSINVPEPGVLALLGVALGGLAFVRSRKG